MKKLGAILLVFAIVLSFVSSIYANSDDISPYFTPHMRYETPRERIRFEIEAAMKVLDSDDLISIRVSWSYKYDNGTISYIANHIQKYFEATIDEILELSKTENVIIMVADRLLFLAQLMDKGVVAKEYEVFLPGSMTLDAAIALTDAKEDDLLPLRLSIMLPDEYRTSQTMSDVPVPYCKTRISFRLRQKYMQEWFEKEQINPDFCVLINHSSSITVFVEAYPNEIKRFLGTHYVSLYSAEQLEETKVIPAEPTILDALEILKYVATIPSEFDPYGILSPPIIPALNSFSGRFFGAEPDVLDALEILKYLAGIPNVISGNEAFIFNAS